MATQLNGIVTPLVTPLTADEAVDTEALHRMVQLQLDAGVRGIFVLGSAGEGNALSDEARDTVIRAVNEAIGGRVSLLAGAGSTCVREAVERVDRVRKIGADIAVLTLPHYHTVRNDDEATRFVREVLEKTSSPVALYNIPCKTDIGFGLDVLLGLAADERIVAIKDSSCDFTFTEDLIFSFAGRNFPAIMVGAPWHVGPAVLMGADGAVTATANIDPVGAVELYNAARSGDLQNARLLQYRMSQLRGIYGMYAMLPGLKFTMKLLGLCDDVCVSPVRPLGEEQKKEIETRLTEEVPGLLSQLNS